MNKKNSKGKTSCSGPSREVVGLVIDALRLWASSIAGQVCKGCEDGGWFPSWAVVSLCHELATENANDVGRDERVALAYAVERLTGSRTPSAPMLRRGLAAVAGRPHRGVVLVMVKQAKRVAFGFRRTEARVRREVIGTIKRHLGIDVDGIAAKRHLDADHARRVVQEFVGEGRIVMVEGYRLTPPVAPRSLG